MEDGGWRMAIPSLSPPFHSRVVGVARGWRMEDGGWRSHHYRVRCRSPTVNTCPGTPNPQSPIPNPHTTPTGLGHAFGNTGLLASSYASCFSERLHPSYYAGVTPWNRDRPIVLC